MLEICNFIFAVCKFNIGGIIIQIGKLDKWCDDDGNLGQDGRLPQAGLVAPEHGGDHVQLLLRQLLLRRRGLRGLLHAPLAVSWHGH